LFLCFLHCSEIHV
ncbi:putative hemolysin activator protein, partial [Serratia symbiotica str. Tucson]